jgi:hypothetical protein
MFIGLINNAIIDWFLPWPEQALLAVSTSLLSEDVRIIIILKQKRCGLLILIFKYIYSLFYRL